MVVAGGCLLGGGGWWLIGGGDVSVCVFRSQSEGEGE